MKPFETTAERQQQIEKLAEYIGKQPDGAELRWLQVEHETDIKMDPKGRDLVRYVVRKRLKREYDTDIGTGIVLSSPQNGLGIVLRACERIGGAIKGAAKKHRRVADRHLPEMSTADQQQMLQLRGFTGTLATFAKENRVKRLGGKDS